VVLSLSLARRGPLGGESASDTASVWVCECGCGLRSLRVRQAVTLGPAKETADTRQARILSMGGSRAMTEGRGCD
jgi:hypothetical protein